MGQTIKESAYQWLQYHDDMYRGDNASDCMIAAFIAGYQSRQVKNKDIANKLIIQTNSGARCMYCGAPGYPVDISGNDLTGIDGEWVDDVIEHASNCIYFDLTTLA